MFMEFLVAMNHFYIHSVLMISPIWSPILQQGN